MERGPQIATILPKILVLNTTLMQKVKPWWTASTIALQMVEKWLIPNMLPNKNQRKVQRKIQCFMLWKMEKILPAAQIFKETEWTMLLNQTQLGANKLLMKKLGRLWFLIKTHLLEENPAITLQSIKETEIKVASIIKPSKSLTRLSPLRLAVWLQDLTTPRSSKVDHSILRPRIPSHRDSFLIRITSSTKTTIDHWPMNLQLIILIKGKSFINLISYHLCNVIDQQIIINHRLSTQLIRFWSILQVEHRLLANIIALLEILREMEWILEIQVKIYLRFLVCLIFQLWMLLVHRKTKAKSKQSKNCRKLTIQKKRAFQTLNSTRKTEPQLSARISRDVTIRKNLLPKNSQEGSKRWWKIKRKNFL